jgi:hypothetical protein
VLFQAAKLSDLEDSAFEESREDVSGLPMRPEPTKPPIKLRESIQSLTVEIKAYESAIANADDQGRGKLPHIELLKETLGKMKERLEALTQT